MTWNGEPIITEFFCWPIPTREFDWEAMLKRDADNYCGCGECRFTVGYGPSERQARVVTGLIAGSDLLRGRKIEMEDRAKVEAEAALSKQFKGIPIEVVYQN